MSPPTRRRSQSPLARLAKKTVIYALDQDEVQQDDIVLLLNSPWGHAALCTQPAELFEAMPEGLHRRPVVSTYVKKRNQISVLRPRPSLGANVDGKRLADYAEDLYGAAYNWAGAITAVSRWLRPNSEGSYFCSQVIAQIFADYGSDLKLGRTPDKVKPRDFLKSDALENVTAECLREVNLDVNPLEYEHIMTAAAESQWAASEMRMNRGVFLACMKRLGKERPKDVHSLRHLWQWLGYKIRPDNQHIVVRLEAAILDEMEAGGYWGFYQQLHERRETILGELKHEAQQFRSGITDCERLDHWLRSQQHTGFSLPKRCEYLNAFRDWHQKTNLLLFKRLVEVFEIQMHDTELFREQYEILSKCRFHSMPGQDSTRCRAGIPRHAGPVFHGKPGRVRRAGQPRYR